MAFQDDSGGIKGLLVQHVEKIVLGFVGLIMLLLILMGTKQKPIEGYSPGLLQSNAQSADEGITNSSFEEVREQRDDNSDDFIQAAALDDKIGIPFEPYSTDQPWAPLLFPQNTKRVDPDLLPITALRVASGYGALALQAGEDPLGRNDGTGGGRDRPGGGLFNNPANAGNQGLPPNITGRTFPGYRPNGAADVKGIYYVSLTGLVPYKRQIDLFNEAFINASGHDDARDQPHYFIFHIERMDVLEGVEVQEWKFHSHTRQLFSQIEGTYKLPGEQIAEKAWDGTAEDPVDPSLGDRSLTSPIPPILNRDLESLVIHEPEIGVYVSQESDRFPSDRERIERPSDDLPAIGLPGDPGLPGETEAPIGEQPGAPASPGRGDPSDREIPEYLLFRYFDLTAQPGKVYRYRVRMYLHDPNEPNTEVEGEGSQGGGDRESDGFGEGRGAATMRGGGPFDPALFAPVPERCLDDTVRTRLQGDRGSANPRNKRISPWSEPSDPILVVGGGEILAGSAIAPRIIRLRDLGLSYAVPGQEPKVGLAVVVWDQAKALDISVEREELVRGSLLNFMESIWALDPVSLVFNEIEDYEFETDAFLLDIRGGTELRSSDRDEELTAPSEVLLIDSEGRLTVCDEIDNMQRYREALYLESEAAPEAEDMPGGELFPGDDGDFGGLPFGDD